MLLFFPSQRSLDWHSPQPHLTCQHWLKDNYYLDPDSVRRYATGPSSSFSRTNTVQLAYNSSSRGLASPSASYRSTRYYRWHYTILGANIVGGSFSYWHRRGTLGAVGEDAQEFLIFYREMLHTLGLVKPTSLLIS